MRLNNLQDLLAGLLFMAFGGAALWFGKSYAFGSATRMGPGFMPNVLGWLLIGLGLFIAARSLVSSGSPIPRIFLRPQIMIIGALVGFALTVERFGLMVAVATVVLIASLASREARPLEMIILAALTAVAAVGLFIYLLGQPMLPWNWGF